MTIILLALAALLFVPAGVRAADEKVTPTVTQSVDYRHGSATLEGFLAYGGAPDGKRPVVLLVHDWDGIDDYERLRAEMVANLGYLAFAVDSYGKGVRPKTREESAAEASKYYKDPALMVARVQAAIDFIKTHPLADADRIAAIGYCFGGKTVLEVARTGVPLRGVVSFHGGLDTATPAAKDAIKCPLLVLHGNADASVTPDKVGAFHQEMLAANAAYTFVGYPDAVHGFTKFGSAAYNERADRKSWAEMERFLKDVLL